ncbi:MAG: autotransporter outer membrane beta-barrel domain-containing protein [Verrucomicrobiota bacterium]
MVESRAIRHPFRRGKYVTGPTLGFNYSDGEIDAYNEVGGGASALNYQSRGYQSAISSLGWQVSRTEKVKARTLTLQGFASWEHEFDPEAGNVRASLATSPFALNGVSTGGFGINSPTAAPGTDWLTVGVASRLMTASGFNFEIDYQTQLFRQDVDAHYVGFRASGRF